MEPSVHDSFISNDFSEPSACDHHSCEWNLVFMIVSFRTILVNLVNHESDIEWLEVGDHHGHAI